MSKLHEVVAVLGSLRAGAVAAREKLAGRFRSEAHLFVSKISTFTPIAEGAKAKTEEQSDIQSTVKDELQTLKAAYGKAITAALQIAETNTEARAAVVIEGENGLDTFIGTESFPATALLDLEKYLGEIRLALADVPTLDPAKGFKMDANTGHYVARVVEKSRTKKVQRFETVAAATDRHPAQVVPVTEDVVVGTIQEIESSGLITPVEKAAMLARCDDTIRAVKAARCRANEQEVRAGRNTSTAKQLLDYILQ